MRRGTSLRRPNAAIDRHVLEGKAAATALSEHNLLARLRQERRVEHGFADAGVKPVALAKTLGYQPSPYEFGESPRPPEERLPRMFIELGYRAARGCALSERRVAEMLGISDIELEERLAISITEEQHEPAYV